LVKHRILVVGSTERNCLGVRCVPEAAAGNQILSDCSGEIIAIDYGKFPSWGIFL
jgi:hypothetical protein